MAVRKNSKKYKLKGCPFCGANSDEVQVIKKRSHGVPVELDGMTYWFVECLDCDNRTGFHWDGDADILGYTNGKEMAIGHWNRRATTASKVILPRLLTEDMISSLFANKFFVEVQESCFNYGDICSDEDCPNCHGKGSYPEQEPIPWQKIQEMYSTIVNHLGELNE